MRKILSAIVLFLAFVNVHAQIIAPVKWKSKIEKKSDTEYILQFDGVIEDDWHVYSQFTPDGGPLAMEVLFNNQKDNFEVVGKATESKTRTAFNDVFGVNETFFEHNVQIRQAVKTNPKSNGIFQVELSYQVCKEVCIQENKYFQLDTKTLRGKEVESFEELSLVPSLQSGLVAAAENDTIASKTADVPAGVTKTADKEKTDPWTIFLGTLLAGILVTFTPCVFPMIPMTVSFFIKQNANKAKGKFNAVFYGICIVVIYVLISLPFHLFESLNPDIFSEISTNVYLNLFFFVVFVIFAISFLGAFEITMPNSLANKADNASNLGGLLGVFFMALTLIIVSFSCTGPALGLILGSVLSTEGGAMLLTIAMLGFGLGLAMPFMLFALFPSLMGNLPKSGGWLNAVKVFFGFVELALAFKFLSNADLVLQLHFLEREVFLAIWIAIFAALTLYLFGKLVLPHDSPVTNLSVGRLSLGLLVLSFTIYLIPGLWGAPLKLISGFPPPMTYSESPLGFGAAPASAVTEPLPEGAKLAVHGIVAFEDYDTGVAYAKKVNKPILLDFTGHACVNCRKMEEFVWSDPKVLSVLKNNVVLISLYGDDKRELPENEQYVSKKGNKIKTIGAKWSDFQITRYESNARPLYVLIGTDEKKLNEPIAYTPDIDTYDAWLKEGISKFK
ncbi:protein-disulfide reductase DsbD family protein [Flavobacterium kingsejongi]|uniref:Thiol:disulfide interchange protein n=1 Tax=Flavobacterium kingsejongi TaxID=1678728 RepID=A0A2S1LR16_9FLAO|nr:cytochrome c biogenesis protein CcdA [Flavobacterium kingsejongi]AWG26086.1 thiol:disulfide interchange protein [Flavobacterium kingsejongi]